MRTPIDLINLFSNRPNPPPWVLIWDRKAPSAFGCSRAISKLAWGAWRRREKEGGGGELVSGMQRLACWVGIGLFWLGLGLGVQPARPVCCPGTLPAAAVVEINRGARLSRGGCGWGVGPAPRWTHVSVRDAGRRRWGRDSWGGFRTVFADSGRDVHRWYFQF